MFIFSDISSAILRNSTQLHQSNQWPFTSFFRRLQEKIMFCICVLEILP